MKTAVITLPGIPEYGYLPPDVTLAVALVSAEQAVPGAGDDIIRLLKPHFPALPIMLVSVTENGFKAYAPFQTARLLAQLQMEQIYWRDVDPSRPPEDDSSLPF
jgi:hypothetical protein